MAAQTPPSEQLFEAAITRDVPAEKYVYNWRDAVLMKSFIDIARHDPAKADRVLKYVDDAMTRLAPKAHGVHPNGIASAIGLAYLQEKGGSDMQTDKALHRVLTQYAAIVRAPNGACSHRVGILELWDDTVYMLGMALIGCHQATGDMAYLDKYADEIIAHAQYLYDSKTGFWYHGWAETSYPTEDNCCQYGWNNNPQHRNNEFWGRGNGWIAMSLVDILEFLPKTDERYPQIRQMYEQMMKTLTRLQDKNTGLWRQLPLHVKDKDNFLESSGTAMFGYAYAKGYRLGLLDKSYRAKAEMAYEGIVNHCIENLGTDQIRLGQICAGTCIGDRQYYYRRPVVAGSESYATGAVLLLANELKISK